MRLCHRLVMVLPLELCRLEAEQLVGGQMLG